MAASNVQRISVSDDWVRRYLTFLGVEFATPDYEALVDLTAAHRRAVTFENVTAILRRQAHAGQPVPPMDAEAILCAWEEGAGGGVCFEIAHLLNRLLMALGYQTLRILARGPLRFLGGHQAVVVLLDGQRYLVEVCSATMPVFEPISLTESVEIRRAGSILRFRPENVDEGWLVERWHNEGWQPIFHYDLRRPDEQVREAAYQRHHTVGGSIIDRLILSRATEHEVFTLRRGQMVHATSEGSSIQQVSEPAEYLRLVQEVFCVPRLPILEGLHALAERGEERT